MREQNRRNETCDLVGPLAAGEEEEIAQRAPADGRHERALYGRRRGRVGEVRIVCLSSGRAMGGRRFLPFLLSSLLLAVAPPASALAERGVHVDPESPAGK